MHGSFIFGLPRESMESMKSTAEYLLSDKNPLHTWAGYPLDVRANDESLTQAFLSDLDINFEKYGYRDNKTAALSKSLYSPSRRGDRGQMNWSNEYTSSDEIEEFASSVNKLRKEKDPGVNGQLAFHVASMGLNLDDFLFKRESQVDWYQLDKVKLARAVEYKTKLFEQLGIPPNFLKLENIQTYSDLLRSNKLIEL